MTPALRRESFRFPDSPKAGAGTETVHRRGVEGAAPYISKAYRHCIVGVGAHDDPKRRKF